MTLTFECNGCGLTGPTNCSRGKLESIKWSKNGPVYSYDNEDDDLCFDCYKATKQFLKDRYNNAKKGVNTGLSTTTITWSPANSVSCSSTSTRDLISFDNIGSAKLTSEQIQDHKRKTGQVTKKRKNVSKK